MNDLFQALNMFQNGMTQLSTGRAIRGAAEQAQSINMNEQDEFTRRQQLTQLGTGLAAQLSSYGANPNQIQSSVGAIMPQQLNNPTDFFAASQMATNPEAKKQLAKAGQGMQSQIASAPMTLAQQSQEKLGWAQLMATTDMAKRDAGSKMAEKSAQRQVPDFEIMPGIIPLEDDVKKLKELNQARIQIQQNKMRLKKMLEESGTEAFSVFSNNSTVMDSMYKSMLANLRAMDGLGVLNPGDIPQLEGQLPDPTSIFKSGGNVIEVYDAFEKSLNDKVAAAGMARGYVPSKSSPLRQNAVNIQYNQQADSAINAARSELANISPDAPRYGILQSIIQGMEAKKK